MVEKKKETKKKTGISEFFKKIHKYKKIALATFLSIVALFGLVALSYDGKSIKKLDRRNKGFVILNNMKTGANIKEKIKNSIKNGSMKLEDIAVDSETKKNIINGKITVNNFKVEDIDRSKIKFEYDEEYIAKHPSTEAVDYQEILLLKGPKMNKFGEGFSEHNTGKGTKFVKAEYIPIKQGVSKEHVYIFQDKKYTKNPLDREKFVFGLQREELSKKYNIQLGDLKIDLPKEPTADSTIHYIHKKTGKKYVYDNSKNKWE